MMKLYFLISFILFVTITCALECYVGIVEEHHLEENPEFKVCYAGYSSHYGGLIFNGSSTYNAALARITTNHGEKKGTICSTDRCNLPVGAHTTLP